MNQGQTNQRESVNALNGANFKLDDLSVAMGTIADLCVFYGDYKNLDNQSKRVEAFHRIRRIAEKAQEDTVSLTDVIGSLFPDTENTI